MVGLLLVYGDFSRIVSIFNGLDLIDAAKVPALDKIGSQEGFHNLAQHGRAEEVA